MRRSGTFGNDTFKLTTEKGKKINWEEISCLLRRDGKMESGLELISPITQ